MIVGSDQAVGSDGHFGFPYKDRFFQKLYERAIKYFVIFEKCFIDC